MGDVNLLRKILVIAVLTASLTSLAPAQTPVLVLDSSSLDERPNPGLTPEKVQAIAMSWLAVGTVVAGALATFAVFLLGKINEVKAQVRAHAAQLQQQQGQLNTHALALPSLASLTLAPPPPASSALPLITGICLLATLLFPACSTSTGNAKKDRASRVTNAVLESAAGLAERVAVDTLVNSAGAALNGDKIDLAHAAAQGLWQEAPSVVNAADVQKIVNAWTGDDMKVVAAATAAAYRQADPQTPADKTIVVNRLAQALSDAAYTATGTP